VTREVRTSIAIEAAPQRVWQVLTDFGEYSNWNPFIRRIDGPLALGAELTFTVATGPERTIVARARILEIEVNRRLVWGGGLPLGLFRGEHTFLIAPTARGAVLENRERFRGPIATLTIRDGRLQAQRLAFEAFNEALKRRVETMTADSPSEATETP
jgi:hypothetical protein